MNNAGTNLTGLIDPQPKRKRPESLLLRFHEVEHSGDLEWMVECCFDAGATRTQVQAVDYEDQEMALIKITMPDAEEFLAKLKATDADGFSDVIWRSK